MELTKLPTSDVDEKQVIPIEASYGDSSPAKTFASNFFKTGRKQDIKWINVNFKVGEKTILSDCWGSVPAGNQHLVDTRFQY